MSLENGEDCLYARSKLFPIPLPGRSNGGSNNNKKQNNDDIMHDLMTLNKFKTMQNKGGKHPMTMINSNTISKAFDLKPYAHIQSHLHTLTERDQGYEKLLKISYTFCPFLFRFLNKNLTNSV